MFHVRKTFLSRLIYFKYVKFNQKYNAHSFCYGIWKPQLLSPLLNKESSATSLSLLHLKIFYFKTLNLIFSIYKNYFFFTQLQKMKNTNRWNLNIFIEFSKPLPFPGLLLITLEPVQFIKLLTKHLSKNIKVFACFLHISISFNYHALI